MGVKRATTDAAVRRTKGIARALTIYGLLLGGSVIFTLPFIWMLGTSFKVDREMFGSRLTLWPMTPVPASASPYLDENYYPTSSGKRFERVRNAIETELASRDLGLGSEVVNRDDAVRVFTPGIFSRLDQTLPASTWDGPAEELEWTIADRIDDEMIALVRRNIVRRLSFGPVRVRSFELQEKEVSAGAPISEFWEITSGDSRLLDRSDAKTPQADLVYDFSASGKQQEVIERTIDLPFDAERLFRIQISLTPDDSWHVIEFYVERNGKKYRGLQTEHTGTFQAKVVTLQEYGPLDAPDSNRIRPWIPYSEIDAGPQFESRPEKVKVTMVFREQGQMQAWMTKCSRNYRRALRFVPFWRYAATSAFLAIMNIIGNIFSCSLVAYAFARLQWPGRNLSFGIMLATLMIPPQVTMIPYFLIIRHLGWYNTLTPLWVVSFFGNAFNIFLLRQFMKGIPRDMEDAAKIDGCNFLQIYWYVIMPLIKPTLACIAIFTFMAVWNDFMGPLIFLADQRLYPLSLGLYAFNVEQGAHFGMMMAGSFMMTLPVIVIFFFAHKYFIQGVTLTGMKG